ncbi:O-antigen ligase family protein [Solibacillus silvestris]
MVIKKDFVVSLFIASSVLGVAVSYSKLYLFHISLMILFAYFLISLSHNNFKIKKILLPSKFHSLFYLMFLWYAITLLWSIDTKLTMNYLFYIFCGMVISLTIIYYSTNQEKQTKLFKVLSVFFFIHIILSLLEVYTPFRLPISPYSNYLSYFGRGAGDEAAFGIPNATNIPTGFQWNPNNFATTMTIIFPFFLLHPKKSIKVLGILAIITLVIASESRGNVLALCLIVIIYLFFTNKKRTMMFGSFFGGAALLFSLFISPILSNSDNYKIREVYSSVESLKLYLNPTGDYQLDSIGVRHMLIERGIQGLKDTYGIGVGGGASNALSPINGVQSMHNFWIELLVEGGVIFFSIFVFWYIALTLKLFKVYKRAKDTKIRYYSLSLFLSMIGFSFGAVSASTVIYLFPMWIMFGFAIATINNYIQSQITKPLERTAN